MCTCVCVLVVVGMLLWGIAVWWRLVIVCWCHRCGCRAAFRLVVDCWLWVGCYRSLWWCVVVGGMVCWCELYVAVVCCTRWVMVGWR